MIGGYDYVIDVTPPPGCVQTILALFLEHWPSAVFENADAGPDMALVEVATQAAAGKQIASDEFFIYQDRAAFERWENGLAYEEEPGMVHVLLGDTVTIVMDSQESAQMSVAKKIEAAIVGTERQDDV